MEGSIVKTSIHILSRLKVLSLFTGLKNLIESEENSKSASKFPTTSSLKYVPHLWAKPSSYRSITE